MFFQFFRFFKIQNIMTQLDNSVDEYRSKKKYMARAVWNSVHIFKTCFWLTFVIHCLACLWLGIGLYQNDKGWIYEFDLQDQNNLENYVCSFEFITATFTTIGYGSLYAVSELEMSTMPFLIVLSLILFSLIMQNIKKFRPAVDIRTVNNKLLDECDDFFVELSSLFKILNRNTGQIDF